MANEPQTFLGKLEAQNRRILQQRHGNIPCRSNLKTYLTFTSKDEHIEQLKNEIRQLKQSKKNKTASDCKPKNTTHAKKSTCDLQIRRLNINRNKHKHRNNKGNDFYRVNNANSIGMFEYRSDLFHKHGKFMLIEQLNNIKNTSTEVLKQRLKIERPIG